MSGVENWLDDLAQRVVISGAKSSLKLVTSGASHGQILGQWSQQSLHRILD